MTGPNPTLDHLAALLAKGRRDVDSVSMPQAGTPRAESILVIKGDFAYDSLNRLLALITRHWSDAGVSCIEIDLGAKDWPERIQSAIASTRVRFCISMAGIVLELAEKTKSIWEQFRFPVVCLHCDHPAYFGRRHRNLPANVVLAYMFRDHAIYQRDHVKASNLVTSIDFGIPDLPVRAPPAGAPPTVVFAKTGSDPRELEARWRTRPALDRLIHDLVDQVGFSSCDAYPSALEAVAAAHRLELQPFDRLTRFLITQVDDYSRRRKSLVIAEAIRAFPVDVYGSGWEHVARDGARARFRGAVPYDALSAAVAEATASVTMNPNIELSAHDRFFTALGAGVLPVSDGNAFIRANFPVLEPYTFDFKSGALESILERIFAMPGDARECARSIRAAAIDRMSTRHAAQQLRATVDLADYLDFSFAPPQAFFIL